LARPAVFAVLLGLAQTLAGCGNDDCSEETELARKFLNEPAHRSCQSNTDCAVVHTGCSGLGFCGQAQLNQSTANSEAWRSRERLLNGCAEDQPCGVCGAAVVPMCTNGLCGMNL
jgi:hypothetical protein